MLSCKDATHLISESQERSLGRMERWGLRLHLWMCVSCRRFEQQMAMIRQAMRHFGRQIASKTDSEDFPLETRERIRKVLAERCDHDH